MLNYRPRGDRVLVKQLPAPEPIEGEVFVPLSQQNMPWEGTVAAVGPGLRNRATGNIDAIDLNVGAHVCFVEHAGYPIMIDGVEYLQMREDEIVGERLPSGS